MVDKSFFAFVLGLLKPRPDAQNRTTALQRVAENKLLDLQVLRVVKDYLDTPFYFTSQDVEVEQNILYTNGSNKGSIRYPCGLCELSDGCIAVVENQISGSIRIIKDGYHIQSIKHPVIHTPWGVCTNLNKEIIITDIHKDQLHIFTRDGSYIRSIGGSGNTNGLLSEPYGVCVNSKGHILVADSRNNRISIFDSDGKFLNIFDMKKREGFPVGVCVDMYDNVYIAEHIRSCIVKLSPDGELLQYFYPDENYENTWSNPCNICVTHAGDYIIILDRYNDQLQIISGSDGSIVASYESDTYITPTNIALTNDGRILASDYNNDKIHEIRKR